MCTLQLGVKIVKLLQWTIFSLRLLNFQIILHLLYLMMCLIKMLSLLYDTNSKFQKEKRKTIRKTDNYITFDFQIELSFESWESVFENNDRHYISVLNTYLRILYSSFHIKKLNTTTKSNTWITLGIRNL